MNCVLSVCLLFRPPNGSILGGLYFVVTLDGFQVHKTADCQSLLVMLPAIDHSVNMLGEDLSCLS
jgi:hypothetical protein